jgi:two-component system response regulator FixJ
MLDQSALVWLVDDDDALRRSLAFTLEQAGAKVRLFSSPVDFLDEYEPVEEECLVLDLQMPQMSGLELATELRRRGYVIPIVMISAHGDIPSTVQAMRLGAIDFLEKPLRREALLSRVKEAVARSAGQQQKRDEHAAIRQRLNGLSRRERELLELIVAGKANKQIAADLHIAEKTVANHRARLMDKTGATNAADLVRMVMEVGGLAALHEPTGDDALADDANAN